MRELSFLERLAENLLKGGFARALKPKLEPVQLAKALAKEMERSRLVGPEAPMVANHYLVYLNPADFARFSGFQANLERELASYLRGYASRKRLPPDRRRISFPARLADPAIREGEDRGADGRYRAPCPRSRLP